jgi:glycolate oxidase iron-sulfur subunit
MAAVASGEAEVDDRFDEVMGFCLQCRACEAVCPSLVPFGRAMEGARAELAVQRPSPQRVAKRLLFGRAIGSPASMAMATAMAALAQRIGAVRLLRRVRGLRPLRLTSGTVGRSWEPEGTPVGTVSLLSGCVMDGWFPQVHESLIGTLRMAGYRVVAPEGQGCCGALAAHEGAAPDAERMARRNVAAFAGTDLVVVDSAGCGAHMKGYGHWAEAGAELASRVVDATEFLARLIDDGLLPRLPPDKGPVAVHDPCHLRHAQRISDEPRAVLAAAGYQPIDIDPQGLCCGAAGAYTLSHPETSAQLGRLKCDQVAASGAPVVATANPGCDMQLRQYVAAGVRVAHPVELYWESVQGAGTPQGVPTLM